MQQLAFLSASRAVSLLQYYGHYLVHCFNNRWRWCSGRFNFRQRTLELDYLRSFYCQVFLISRFDFFLSLRTIKTNHLLHILRNYEIKFKIIVGDIFSNLSIRSHDKVYTSLLLQVSSTYDWAILNNNWPCKLV